MQALLDVAHDIRGIPPKAEVAPTSVIVSPVEPEMVKETSTPAKTRAVRRPAPLNLKSSNFMTATPIPVTTKTGGLKTSGFNTTALPAGWVFPRALLI